MNRAFFRIPLLAAAALLAGCDLLGGGSSRDPLLPRPESLHPERDAFVAAATRSYLWKEGVRGGNADSSLVEFPLEATRGADTVVGGDTLLRVAFRVSGNDGPVPAAALARLGFRPARFLADTAAVPDPGPGLPFPENPAPGWRLDTVVGDLRFVRALRGVEIVKLSGWRHECWAFSESTWAGQKLLGAGSSWMGRWGLVRHRFEWEGFAAAGPSGTLYREIIAP